MSSYLAGVPGKPIRDMDFWSDAEQMDNDRLYLIRRLGDPEAKITRRDIGCARRMLEHCRVVPVDEGTSSGEGSS
jgi:hypothetical protein